MVVFDPETLRWQNDLPKAWIDPWTKQLPLAYVPRTYSGITTGSERTVIRGATDDNEGAPRPIRMSYSTSGRRSIHSLTRVLHWGDDSGVQSRFSPLDRFYHLSIRHRRCLGAHSAYDPVHSEIVLFGGGHVAEDGGDGRLTGYTGTWSFQTRIA